MPGPDPLLPEPRRLPRPALMLRAKRWSRGGQERVDVVRLCDTAYRLADVVNLLEYAIADQQVIGLMLASGDVFDFDPRNYRVIALTEGLT